MARYGSLSTIGLVLGRSMLLVGFPTSVGALLGVAIERQETNPARGRLCFRDHFLEEGGLTPQLWRISA